MCSSERYFVDLLTVRLFNHLKVLFFDHLKVRFLDHLKVMLFDQLNVRFLDYLSDRFVDHLRVGWAIEIYFCNEVVPIDERSRGAYLDSKKRSY